MQARDELVGVLTHSTAQDQERGPHQILDAFEVLVEVGGPGLPREAAPDTCGSRGSALGWSTADLHLPELGVRYEDAVDEDAGADTRAQREEDDDTALARADPEPHLRDPGGVGVVDDADLAFERLGELLSDRVVDPGGVDVGGREQASVHRDPG